MISLKFQLANFNCIAIKTNYFYKKTGIAFYLFFRERLRK
jgi:hypothetical protein